MAAGWHSAVWFWLPMVLLALSGCRTYPADPRAWPMALTVLHPFDASVADAEVLAGSPADEPRHVLAKLEGARTVQRLEVVDPVDFQVYWQHVFRSATNHVEEPTCSYQFLAGTQRRDDAGVWFHVACYARDVAHVIRVHYPTHRQDTLFSRRPDPSLNSSAGFDISFCGPVFPETSGEDPAPGVFKVGYGYYPGRRELLLVDPVDGRRVVCDVPTGNPLGPPVTWVDLDGDGARELLLESTAPGSGRVSGGLADSTAYLGALEATGRWRWLHATGPGGGGVGWHWESGAPQGRLFAWRSHRNYGRQPVGTRVMELDPATGSIRREAWVDGLLHWPGGSWRDSLAWGLQVEVKTGRLRWWSRTFLPRGPWSGLTGVTHLAPGLLPRELGGPLIQAVDGNQTLWLLDEQLRVQASSRWRVLDGPRRSWTRPSAEGPTTLHLARDGAGLMAVVALTPRPLWAWWPWRWRWPLALGLSLPMTGVALAALVRYGRLRLRTRRVLVAHNRQLAAAHEDLRRLLQRHHRVQEEERSRIARDLHDELGQHLVGLRYGLRLLPPQETPPEAFASPATLVALVDQALVELRRLVHELKPMRLERLGLASALEGELERIGPLAGWTWTMEGAAACPPLPPDVALSVFRLLQEALTNVVKHAQARQVSLRLTLDQQVLNVTLEDDGVGFGNGPVRPEAMGLLGMRERAIDLGARLDIQPRPGGGTRICLWLPLHPSNSAEPT